MALTDNLVSYYKLDETSGTTATDAHGSNDGTITNATVNQTGKIGKALLFDATGERVSMSASGVTGNFTASCWVKGATGGGGESRILVIRGDASAGNKGLCIAASTSINSGNIGVLMESIAWGSDSSVDIYDDTWRFLVLTWNGTTLNLYINGSGTASAAVTNTPSTSTQNYIGANYTSYDDFDGLVDEVGIWSRVLSSAEISELYNSGYGLAYPFVSDVTLNVSTLTLSTTQQTPAYFIDITQGALSLTTSLLTPTVQGAYILGTPQSVGMRELSTNWPNAEGLVAGVTKQTGNPNLVAIERRTW